MLKVNSSLGHLQIYRSKGCKGQGPGGHGGAWHFVNAQCAPALTGERRGGFRSENREGRADLPKMISTDQTERAFCQQGSTSDHFPGVQHVESLGMESWSLVALTGGTVEAALVEGIEVVQL